MTLYPDIDMTDSDHDDAETYYLSHRQLVSWLPGSLAMSLAITAIISAWGPSSTWYDTLPIPLLTPCE